MDRTLASKIDHTLLRPDATAQEIRRICREAAEYGFHSACVNSGRAALARDMLRGTGVRLCVVVGFPLGCTVAKSAEAKAAVELGAEEIDMVMDIGRAKEGDWAAVEEDIRSVRSACPGQVLKVILETCLLTQEEILRACQCAKNAGADFVKTSTGFSAGGAREEDVALMKQSGLLVKASGGIRTRQQALAMLAAGADRIGASSSIGIITTEGEDDI